MCAKRCSNGIPKQMCLNTWKIIVCQTQKNKNLKAKNPSSIPFTVYTLSGPKKQAVRLFLPDLHAAAADTNLELWAKLAMDVLSNQLCLPDG